MQKEQLKFIFWNIQKKVSNLELILEYGSIHNIDIIAICESCEFKNVNFRNYRIVEHIAPHKDINVFVRRDLNLYYTKEESRFCTLRILDGYCINLALVHLNSDFSPNACSYRFADISNIKNSLSNEEVKYKSKKTMVVGDFNANIFDDCILDWNGFNARLFKFLTKKGTESRHKVKQDIFYCPMLNIYIDNIKENRAKGSYYYEQNNVKWMCVDQILFKKQLIEKIDVSKILFLDILQNQELVKNNKPKEEISDHIPLYFEITK